MPITSEFNETFKNRGIRWSKVDHAYAFKRDNNSNGDRQKSFDHGSVFPPPLQKSLQMLNDTRFYAHNIRLLDFIFKAKPLC
ncbi:hypothetical protein CEXT_723181 [Caerostris extrusa]|uniref:Uncharacterized protein n=1 Tax=Caerostris extrusa TaxID=172846 RepID=A0AAV4XZW3_CAEEX|nr:hypothetical protein CEXT_723181 [Caerostris extrusa]